MNHPTHRRPVRPRPVGATVVATLLLLLALGSVPATLSPAAADDLTEQEAPPEEDAATDGDGGADDDGGGADDGEDAATEDPVGDESDEVVEQTEPVEQDAGGADPETVVTGIAIALLALLIGLHTWLGGPDRRTG